nr:hypothetical protein [Streptomyces endocoffeicus]
MFGAAAEEIGPHGDDDAQTTRGIGRGQESVDELIAFGGVGAEGVELFELVDDQPRVTVGVLGYQPLPVDARGVLAGGEDAYGGRLRTGHLRAAQARDEAGAQQRGLATARRTEHSSEPAGARQLEQVVGELAAAEEQVGVAGLESDEPPVRGLVVLVLGVRLGR